MNTLNCHLILTEQQHGFWQYRSCVTQLITTHDVAKYLNEKGRIFARPLTNFPIPNHFISYTTMGSEALY